MSNQKYDEMLTRVSGKLTSCEGMILPVSKTTKVQCKISPHPRHTQKRKNIYGQLKKYSTVFVTMKETNRAGGHGCCSYKEKMDMDQSMMCSTENLHCTTIDRAVTLRCTPQGKRKRGRPKATWQRTAKAELKCLNLHWGQASQLTMNPQE